MFHFNDTQFQLDLHHRHAAELRRQAAEARLVREATAGHRRRWSFGAWRGVPLERSSGTPGTCVAPCLTP